MLTVETRTRFNDENVAIDIPDQRTTRHDFDLIALDIALEVATNHHVAGFDRRFHHSTTADGNVLERLYGTFDATVDMQASVQIQFTLEPCTLCDN